LRIVWGNEVAACGALNLRSNVVLIGLRKVAECELDSLSVDYQDNNGTGLQFDEPSGGFVATGVSPFARVLGRF
jgi:hypothetical protein